MRLTFTKMHGAGNDFVVVDQRSPVMTSDPAARAALCARLCDRRRGIGADGVLLLQPDATHDFAMRYHNADGGIAEFCGNGARCIARFALSSGLGRDGRVTFATDAGVKAATLRPDGRIALEFGAVDLGEPLTLDACGRTFAGRRVRTGVPHFVLPVTDIATIPFAEWALPLRAHAAHGPLGANVDFVEPRADGRIAMRTWERGVEGETLACGSGAIATALWAIADGGARSPVTVRTAGGEDLVVELGERDGVRQAVLVGPAVAVYTGVWQEA